MSGPTKAQERELVEVQAVGRVALMGDMETRTFHSIAFTLPEGWSWAGVGTNKPDLTADLIEALKASQDALGEMLAAFGGGVLVVPEQVVGMAKAKAAWRANRDLLARVKGER